jgi:hypothetical protein
MLLLNSTDFMNFQVVAKSLAYNKVPFSKVAVVQYEKQFPFTVRYKLTHADTDYIDISVSNANVGTRLQIQANILPIFPAIVHDNSAGKIKLSEAKEKDLKCMLRYMPLVDRQFYATILETID